MKRSILVVLVGNRTGSAVSVQKILTGNGCIIKTRLGMHEATGGECANTGLIILELSGSDAENTALIGALGELQDVKAQLVELTL